MKKNLSTKKKYILRSILKPGTKEKPLFFKTNGEPTFDVLCAAQFETKKAANVFLKRLGSPSTIKIGMQSFVNNHPI